MTDRDERYRDQREFNRRLIAELESQGVAYAIGGSVAAMVYSEPRSTIDIDVMIDVDQQQLELVVDTITAWGVYIDPLETIDEFMRPGHLPINVVDGLSGTKADIYITRTEGHDRQAMVRRRHLVLYEDPELKAWFLSPEDIIIYKLDYYRQSEGIATKHPKDIAKMLSVVGHELDLVYLDEWTTKLDLNSIWSAIWSEHSSGV
jgi:hypothetical protein